MQNIKIGIIGFGNMGRAMAESMRNISYNFRRVKISVYDKDTKKTDKVVRDIDVASNIRDLVTNVDTVILAVKPQDFDSVLFEIKDIAKEKLIISIAAGITTGYIERILGEVEVIRAMPNMPAKIDKGMIGLCKGKFAESMLGFVADLFYSLGQVIIIEEEMMSALTAVSGSGPAYVCHFLEKESMDIYHIPWLKKQRFLREFRKAAEGVGFSKRDAVLLVKTTFSGTVDFLKKTNIPPVELKKQVASTGGTTEAALTILQNGGSLEEAVQAAKRRAEELSKKE